MQHIPSATLLHRVLCGKIVQVVARVGGMCGCVKLCLFLNAQRVEMLLKQFAVHRLQRVKCVEYCCPTAFGSFVTCHTCHSKFRLVAGCNTHSKTSLAPDFSNPTSSGKLPHKYVERFGNGAFEACQVSTKY